VRQSDNQKATKQRSTHDVIGQHTPTNSQVLKLGNHQCIIEVLSTHYQETRVYRNIAKAKNDLVLNTKSALGNNASSLLHCTMQMQDELMSATYILAKNQI